MFRGILIRLRPVTLLVWVLAIALGSSADGCCSASE